MSILLKNETTHESLLGFNHSIKNPHEKGSNFRNLKNRLCRNIRFKAQLGMSNHKIKKNKVLTLERDQSVVTGLEFLREQ